MTLLMPDYWIIIALIGVGYWALLSFGYRWRHADLFLMLWITASFPATYFLFNWVKA